MHRPWRQNNIARVFIKRISEYEEEVKKELQENNMRVTKLTRIVKPETEIYVN